jgi:hypothetical protein
MKRFIHIIIAGILLFTTTGFTITKHYCAGNLIDVAINATPDPCCDISAGCCSDEESFHQLKADFIAADISLIQDLSINYFIIPESEVLIIKSEINELPLHFYAHTPPLISGEEQVFISQQCSLSPPVV